MPAITRLLKLQDRGRELEVAVRISWPTQTKTAWSCSWEIVWPDRKRSNSAGGFDAIQALTNALQVVGCELYLSDEHKSGNLSWGGKWLGYGFPVPNNIRDLLVGDDKQYF
jgi:hypothetical protein